MKNLIKLVLSIVLCSVFITACASLAKNGSDSDKASESVSVAGKEDQKAQSDVAGKTDIKRLVLLPT